jgi:hypothetical protein
MQNLMTRKIKDETLGHVHYRYNICQPGKSKETAMHHVITHIQEVEKRKLHLSIPTY